MIEKDDSTAKRHEFGRDGRVISDQYRRSIEKCRRLVNEFDALVEPEVSDSGGSGVSAPDDVPTVSFPPPNGLPQDGPVDLEARLKFRHRYPDGSWRIPVESDTNSSWLVFTPEAGMPRVQLWTTDSDGRPVITPGPPSRHFIVRAEEHDYIAMLFSESEWAVMWPGSDREAYVGLPRTVLDVNHWTSWVPNDIAVSPDEREPCLSDDAYRRIVGSDRPPKPLPCYFPGSPIDPSNPVRESEPDGEDVLMVMRVFRDEID